MNRDDVIAYMAAVDAAFAAYDGKRCTEEVLAALAEARRLAVRVRAQVEALGHGEAAKR